MIAGILMPFNSTDRFGFFACYLRISEIKVPSTMKEDPTSQVTFFVISVLKNQSKFDKQK